MENAIPTITKSDPPYTEVFSLVTDLEQAIAKYSAYLDKATLDTIKVNALKDALAYKDRYGFSADDTKVMTLHRQTVAIRNMLIKASPMYHPCDIEVCVLVNNQYKVISITDLYRVARESSSYIERRMEELSFHVVDKSADENCYINDKR